MEKKSDNDQFTYVAVEDFYKMAKSKKDLYFMFVHQRKKLYFYFIVNLVLPPFRK